MKSYDVVIIGAGPGGYVSAIRAAQLGAKTALIEKENVGGTCLNVGCIPTKALLKNVEILHNIEMGKQRGIFTGDLVLDYRKAIKEKNNSVRMLVRGVEHLLSANGIDLYHGKAIVHPNKTVEIESERTNLSKIKYQKLIIATGAIPSMPSIEGLQEDGVVTSDGLLALEKVPEHLIIIGGGVIGCELACIMRAYGGKVTIVEILPELVSTLDNDISKYMHEVLETKGIDVQLNTEIERVVKQQDGTLKILIKNEANIEKWIVGDKVLVSVGRRSNHEGLEKLELEKDGTFIKVNDRLETNVQDVYAIGDVASRKQLAHVASEMGIIAAENAMGWNRCIDLDIVPSCIYTIPEMSSVGMSEKEAVLAGHEILIGKFSLLASGKAIAIGEPEGLFKVVADKKTGELLGAHLIGKSATEIIGEMVAFIKMGATIDDLIDTIHAHPTISEAIPEAARDARGKCIHMI